MNKFDPYDDSTSPEDTAPGDAALGSPDNPLPVAIVGKIAKPFALFFTGKWRFDRVRDLWTPAMNLIPLEVGCNGIVQHERRGKFQTDASALTNCAKRAPRVRVYLQGDERLGEFADFQHVYHVQRKVCCWGAACGYQVPHYHQEGRVYSHHVLRCVQYTSAENGDVIKTVDYGWLDGLYAHLLKTGELQPHPGLSPQNVGV